MPSASNPITSVAGGAGKLPANVATASSALFAVSPDGNGSGDVFLAANNPFTGANTFAGVTTFTTDVFFENDRIGYASNAETGFNGAHFRVSAQDFDGNANTDGGHLYLDAGDGGESSSGGSGDVYLRPGSNTNAGLVGDVRIARGNLIWDSWSPYPYLRILQLSKLVDGPGIDMSIESQTATIDNGETNRGGNITLSPGDGGGSASPGEFRFEPFGGGSIPGVVFKPNNATAGFRGGLLVGFPGGAYIHPISDARGPLLYAEDVAGDELNVLRSDGVFVGLA